MLFSFLQEQIKTTLAKSVRGKCYKAKKGERGFPHRNRRREDSSLERRKRVESSGEKQVGPTADARPQKAQGRTPPLSVARPLRYLSLSVSSVRASIFLPFPFRTPTPISHFPFFLFWTPVVFSVYILYVCFCGGGSFVKRTWRKLRFRRRGTW